MLVDELVRNIQHGKQTDLILLDFRKAFDKVSHNKLIYKLHQLGVRDRNLTWIRGFFSDRSQRVVVDGEFLSSVPVTSGVPQDSVLGEILFLAYINDLSESVESQVTLFAYDTVVSITMDKQDSPAVLQGDLKQLQFLETLLDMEFNPGKCQVIHVTTSRYPLRKDYVLHGQVLETTTSARYMGVDISDNLNWSDHINRVTSKASSSLGFIRRNIPNRHQQLRSAAYKAVVRPQVEYAASVWDPHTVIHINQIERVSRRAARWVMSDLQRTSSVTTTCMLNTLGRRNFAQRRTDPRFVLMYKVLHGLVVIPQTHLVRPHRISRNPNPFAFCQIQTTKNFYNYSFFPLTIHQWNKL